MGCVYSATNIRNGKRYIGKTVKTLARRKAQHLSCARKHTDDYLVHKALIKYGYECFHWEVFVESSSPVILADLERKAIAYFGTQAPEGWGYNLTTGGEGVTGRTFTVSAETRAKISAGMTAHLAAQPRPPMPATIRDKIRATKTGRKFGSRSAEWIQNQRTGQARAWARRRATGTAYHYKKKGNEPCPPTSS